MRNDLSGSRLRESLDLSWRVYDYVVDLPFFRCDQVNHLVKLSCKQVQAGQNSAVRTQLVRLHDFLVLNGVSDVDIAGIGDLKNGGVKIYVVASFALLT